MQITDFFVCEGSLLVYMHNKPSLVGENAFVLRGFVSKAAHVTNGGHFGG